MTIDLISLKLNTFIRNNYKIFFLGVGVAYLKEPRAALVLNSALTVSMNLFVGTVVRICLFWCVFHRKCVQYCNDYYQNYYILLIFFKFKAYSVNRPKFIFLLYRTIRKSTNDYYLLFKKRERYSSFYIIYILCVSVCLCECVYVNCLRFSFIVSFFSLWFILFPLLK
jgi:hypothetical protein